MIANIVEAFRCGNRLEAPDEQELRRHGAWLVFRARVIELAKIEGLARQVAMPVFERTRNAYLDLKAAWVPTPRPRRKVKGHSPALERRAQERGVFLDRFFGRLEYKAGKKFRNFGGVEPEVVAVVRYWQSAWNELWPHTAEGQRRRNINKKKSNAKQAKRPEVKAAKAAYAKSERGVAAQARAAAKKRRRRVVGRGAAEQAMYDSWHHEETLEKVLADV